jgi:DNA polymerase III delta prime subunit
LAEGSLDAILEASQGDMRKAVTFLQSCHQLTVGKSDVTPSIVNDVSGNVSRHFLHYIANELIGRRKDS